MPDASEARLAVITRQARRRIVLATLLMLGGTLSLSAQAQQTAGADQAAAGTDQTDEQQQLQQVVVTGSLIRRNLEDTPAPIQVISAQDIANTGLTSVNDVLHTLTADGQGNLNQNFSGSYATGAAGVSLRGMTVDATLVLIDGHRMVDYPISDDGQRSFVDVSNLPLGAVDRIEVLKDGASAIYGSDAIAGVVNIILKKTFVGSTASVDYGTSDQGDATTYHAQAMWGFGDLAADGHNTYINLEWRHQDPLSLDARPKYANFDFYDQYTPGCTAHCAPVAYGVVQPGLPYPLPLEGTVQGMVGAYVPGVAGGPASIVPGSYMGLSACPNPTAGSANVLGGCEYDQARYVLIQPETSNYNVLVRHTMALAGGWTGTLSASLFESLAQQLDPPLSSFNRFPQDAQDPTAAPILLPIGNVNNPYPANEAWLDYRFADIGPAITDTDTKVFRFVYDLNGTVAGTDLAASIGYMRAITNLSYFNFVTYSGLSYAIANNLYFVGANANQNANGVDNIIAPPTSDTATSELEYFEASATRSVFALPGGPLSVALGIGARQDGQQDPGEPEALNNVPGNLTTFISGTETNENVHAEVDLPVIHMLDLNAALRWDNYAQTGTATTPKFGFRLAPIDFVALRGTYQQGFRAPDPAERGNSGVAFFENEGVDPARCPTTGLPDDCGSGFIANVDGSNPNLKPERSRSYTIGIVLQPLRQTQLAVDWWQIRRTDEIISGVGTPIIVRGPVQAAYPTLPGPILEEIAPYENIGSDEPKGIDFDLTSSVHLGPGQLHLLGSYTHLISQVYCGFAAAAPGACADVVGTQGPSGISGDTGTPANRSTDTISYGMQQWEAGVTLNYTSGMKDIDPIVALSTGTAPTCLNAWWPACYTNAFYDFDIFGMYNVTKELQASLHILNVGNQSAPYDYQAAYGQSNYNNAFDQQGAVGRFFEVSLKYSH